MNALAHKLRTLFGRGAPGAMLLIAVLLGGTAGRTPAQEDAAASKPDLKAEIKEFKAALSDRKAAKDDEAKNLIAGWLKRWDDLEEKERQEVVKTIALTFLVKRPPAESGLFNAAVVALGRMDKAGATALKKAFESKPFDDKEWLQLRADMLKQIGRAKDPAMIKFLLDTATRSPEDMLMASAGEALGNYAEADQKVRKDIFKDLYKKFVEVQEASSTLDPGDATAQRKRQTFAAIADPWNSTLGKLSGQNFRDPQQWQKFWNEHKSEDWDKAK